MAIYYFETDPILDQISTADSFLIIATPNPPKDTKKKEEVKSYKEILAKHQKSLSAIKTGTVNLHNRPIVFSNIFKDFDWWENFDRYHIYYCKATSATQSHERYSYNTDVYVYEFEVRKDFQARDELVRFLLDHYNYCELIGTLLSKFSYSNPEYEAKLKESIQYVNSLLDQDRSKQARWNGEMYYVMREMSGKGKTIDANTLWVIENGHINIEQGGLSDDTLYRMITQELVLSAREYVKRSLPDQKYRASRDTKEALARRGDLREVQDIIKLLGLETPKITLTAHKYGGYQADSIIERVEFETVDQLKTHIIKKYDVVYSALSGDITELTLDDDEDSGIVLSIMFPNGNN